MSATASTSPSPALASATMTPTVMTATATASSSSSSSSAAGPLQSQGECELLGSFALIVQAALGALALLSLVYKRWRERPQRPLKVWYFDVSKQVFGSVLVHISNIFMSMLTSGRFTINTVVIAQRSDDEYVPNPCSFYLLNLAIDTTLGIPILIILIRVFTALVALTPLGKPLDSIQSGYYGHPPNAWWWLKQSLIYFSGLFGMKICVLVIFLAMPWISRVGDWALGWTEGNERLQVAFVMMIFPLIMNAIQYYIIDSFIKKPVQDHHHHVALPSLDDDDDDDDDLHSFDHARFSCDGQLDDHRLDLDAESNKPRHPSPSVVVGNEYDPDVDSDSHTIIGSSSSAHVPRIKNIPADLLAKE